MQDLNRNKEVLTECIRTTSLSASICVKIYGDRMFIIYSNTGLDLLVGYMGGGGGACMASKAV